MVEPNRQHALQAWEGASHAGFLSLLELTTDDGFGVADDSMTCDCIPMFLCSSSAPVQILNHPGTFRYVANVLSAASIGRMLSF